MFCEISVTDITYISHEISVYMRVTNISQTNISCSRIVKKYFSFSFWRFYQYWPALISIIENLWQLFLTIWFSYLSFLCKTTLCSVHLCSSPSSLESILPALVINRELQRSSSWLADLQVCGLLRPQAYCCLLMNVCIMPEHYAWELQLDTQCVHLTDIYI